MRRKIPLSCKLALSFFAAFFALTIFSFIGSVGFLKPDIAQAADAVIGFTEDNPGIRKAIEAQSRHTDWLMDIPGVVGHGVGVSSTGEPEIRIFVTRAGIPGIPSALENVPTKVVVTGMIVAYADPTARFSRPVPIGVSTGHPKITAGTIGCRVIDTQGNVYALSNNHVYANQNDATSGDSALQPGPYDGGKDPADAIGALAAFVPIDFSGGENTMDAAIAVSSTEELGTSTPADDGFGTPSSILKTDNLLNNVAIQKYGRTTGLTKGNISEINVTVDVCYEVKGLFRCVKQARFVNQIGITPGSFSAGGDSGSLIVTDDENKNPVGLLFAGGSTRTLANRIDLVLNHFKVSVDNSQTTSPDNYPPTADFSYTVDGLIVTFTDESTDSDGSVVAWSWDFGDGETSTAKDPSHTYGSGGSYNVSLTVTDDDGATGSTSQNITVTSGSNTEGITLSATGYKVRGRQHADLTWSGETSEKVDIYRDGSIIATRDNNTGSYTDNIGNVGGGSYTYKVCEAGTNTCSNVTTVTF